MGHIVTYEAFINVTISCAFFTFLAFFIKKSSTPTLVSVELKNKKGKWGTTYTEY